MERIAERSLFALVWRILPPLICANQYFVTVGVALVAAFAPSPVSIKVVAAGLALIGLFMIPFWYKRFFNGNVVGTDMALVVQWSQDCISFAGAYFWFEVTPQDVVAFRTIGFRCCESCFMLKVTIQIRDGKKQTVYLNTTMPRKLSFLSFLEANAREMQMSSTG